MKTIALFLVFMLSAVSVFAADAAPVAAEVPAPAPLPMERVTAQSIVRLSRVRVDPAHLEEYLVAAKACGAASMEKEPGVYKISAYNTSGFLGSEAKDKYLDILKAEAADEDREAAANAVMKDFSLEVTQFAKDDVKIKITTSIPESGWSYTKDALVENDDPDAFGAGAICFKVRENLEMLDTNKDSFKNLQEIEDEGDVYESIEDIWPDYPSKDDFFFNEEEY